MKSIIGATVLLLSLHAVVSGAANGLPPIDTVNIAHAAIAVNGNPFFPIMLFDAPTDDASLAEFREWGFNTVVMDDAKATHRLPAVGFYAALRTSKPVQDLSGIALAIGVDHPAASFPKDMAAKTRDANANTLQCVRGCRLLTNTLGYWVDEPAGVKAGALLNKEKFEELAQNLTHVAAPCVFPVPYQPISSVGDAVAN